TFSQGRILISHLRNRLQADTIRALMCFSDWSREDFVSNGELVGYLNSNSDVDGEDFGNLVDNEIYVL
ncbi:hypothetical protein EV361DRAFT_811523, partial [Lentinula raphanica]